MFVDLYQNADNVCASTPIFRSKNIFTNEDIETESLRIESRRKAYNWRKAYTYLNDERGRQRVEVDTERGVKG